MRKIKILSYFITLYVLVFILNSCKHDPLIQQIIIAKPIDTVVIIPPLTGICFQDQILPIIQSNCAKSGCHNVASSEKVMLTNYNNISSIVIPGNPSNSKLYKVINASPGSEDFMPSPPNTPLNTAQKDLIYTWITEGAKNTNCPSACDTNIFTFSGAVLPTIQQKCVGCHSGASPSGNLSLTNHPEILTAVNSRNLYARITNGSSPMPPTGLMDACKIRQIKKWIDAGKLNN